MPKRSRHLPEDYNDHTAQFAHQMGERIRVRREQLELTQEGVRDRMADEQVYVSRTQYSRIERGDSVASAVQVLALAHALETSYSWLLEGIIS